MNFLTWALAASIVLVVWGLCDMGLVAVGDRESFAFEMQRVSREQWSQRRDGNLYGSRARRLLLMTLFQHRDGFGSVPLDDAP